MCIIVHCPLSVRVHDSFRSPALIMFKFYLMFIIIIKLSLKVQIWAKSFQKYGSNIEFIVRLSLVEIEVSRIQISEHSDSNGWIPSNVQKNLPSNDLYFFYKIKPQTEKKQIICAYIWAPSRKRIDSVGKV